jgi:hypothetical protein
MDIGTPNVAPESPTTKRSKYQSLLEKIKNSLLRQFEEKKEQILAAKDNYLDTQKLSSDTSIEDENLIDYYKLFLRKNTFLAIKDNY